MESTQKTFDRKGPAGWDKRYQLLLVPASVVTGLILWYLVISIGDFPAFILPPPQLVWERFWDSLGDGTLVRHSLYTLAEVLAGLALGSSAAAALGYLLAKSPTVERLISPYVVASQSVPIVAIDPLLVIWFGPGR